MVMVVVEIVVSMASVGELELGSDGVGIIMKVFGGHMNVVALTV